MSSAEETTGRPVVAPDPDVAAPPGEGTGADGGRRDARRAARAEIISRTSTGLTLAIIMTATFVQLIDISIVNVAIPSIEKNLSASSSQIQLVVAGYLLAFAMTLITGARLGDIFGRKRLFLIGMIGFTAASAACGAAPTANFLIIARVVQGACSALMYPQVLSVIQVSIAPKDRGRAFGILGAVIGLATILGPLAGGLLIAGNIAHLDWRSIFYVNLPIGAVAIFGAVTRLPDSKAPDAPHLDIPGALLATAGVFLLVFPLVQGRQDGWPLWGWIMLGACAPVFAVFAFYERRRSAAERSPLVHASLVKDRAFVSGLVLMIVFFAGLPAFFFTFSLYLQVGYGFSALRTGLTIVPFAAGNLVASILSNRLSGRLGTRLLSLGVAIVLVGMTLTLVAVHGIGAHLSWLDLAGELLISGFGMGFFLPPVTNVILAGIQSRAAGSASGVLATLQQVGGSLGIALIGVVSFGVLGSSATASGQSVIPQLTRDLRAAGLPSAAIPTVTNGFLDCFTAQSHAKDPTVLSPACRSLQAQANTFPNGPIKDAVETAITKKAQPTAQATNFRKSFSWGIVYELVVFGLAFLITFLLPKVKPGGHGAPPGGGAPA